jgi:hypothetical protein
MRKLKDFTTGSLAPSRSGVFAWDDGDCVGELLVTGDMDCVPSFGGWMIEKVGAATEVESCQLILGPMLKALPKFS